MMKEQFSNEVTIPTFLENDFNTSELPIQPSTSVFNFTLPANETESDLQQKDWMFQPLFEIPSSISMENSSPLSIPSLPTMQTNQTISTINQDANMEHYDDIIFNDIDQIVNHNRRWINGHRVMTMLCKLKNGEQHWVSTNHLRKDSRVSGLVDRYYRDLKHPYWAKRSSRNKAKRY